MTAWKIALGVGCGILLAVGALVFGCTALVGYGAHKVQEEKAAKAAAVTVSEYTLDDEGEWLYVRGSVRNSGSAPVTYVKVVAEFLDASGAVVDSDFTYAVSSETLAPGAAKTFEIMHRDSDRIVKARARIAAD